jgi:hypothetical protein
MKKLLGLILATTVLVACGDEKEFIKIAGGGITFNYRYSEAGMTVIAQQKQTLPAGGKVEALFDVPGTKTRQLVSIAVLEGKLTYKLQSLPLTGFKKGGEYKVTVRVVDAAGKELDHKERVFVSDMDQATLPSKPLVKDLAFTPQLENL